MPEAPKLASVAALDFRSDNVVELLDGLLAKAKAGEIRAVAVAYEYTDGTGGWSGAFGPWSHRLAMIGRLHVLAQQITLNDVLEWKPGT